MAWEVFDRRTGAPLVEPEPDLAEVHRIVETVLSDEPVDGDMWRAGVLLLSSTLVTPSTSQLRAFTGLPANFISTARFYLRACGVWEGPRAKRWRVVHEWDHPEYGHFAFLMDCMVAAGRVLRVTTTRDDGSLDIRYRQRMLGDYTECDNAELMAIPWEQVARPEERERHRLAIAEAHRRDPDGPQRRAQARQRARERAAERRRKQHAEAEAAEVFEQRRSPGMTDDHRWELSHVETLGGVDFWIDVCTHPDHHGWCKIRRARQLGHRGIPRVSERPR